MSGPAEAAERRLHPWSWLFVLVQQLRQFVVPLLALLLFGTRRDAGGAWADAAPAIAVAVAVLVAASVWQYLTFRYRIGADRVTVRSGLLHRTVREIPFARIHDVSVRQSPLHRLFGVAELRLESAGGRRPEAEMRVLALADALALEARVRQGATVAAGPAGAAPPATANGGDGHVLLAMPTAEVLRLGLISNRGTIVAAAAFGLLWQLLPDRLLADLLAAGSRRALGYADGLHLGIAAAAAVALGALLCLLALLRLLSVALALARYHGFTLTESGRRLRVERGLFGRVRSSVARRRIQAWTLQEGVLHRLFGRRTLRIDTAVAERHGDGQRSLRELAPLATPEACDALLRHLLPGIAWPPATWRPAPRGSAWRLMLPSLPLAPLVAAALVWRVGPWGAAALLAWPCSALLAAKAAARLGHAVDAQRVAVRGGWWSRYWRLAEIDKLQALQLRRSPLDRLCGTATLWLDTAGADAAVPPLRIRFLPAAEAEALRDRLAAMLARRRLRW